MAKRVCIGVDVGGTNTDAVVLHRHSVLSSAKEFTTRDVTKGVARAIQAAVSRAERKGHQLNIRRVNIGTTHFVNAVVQRRGLARVAVVRLCGTAARSLPPFSDFPPDLKDALCAGNYLVNGGYQFDGQEITPVDTQEILEVIAKVKKDGVKNVVIVGIFSPVNPAQEKQVAALFKEHYPEVSVTLAHQVGHIGLLERENAAILNECLKPLCEQTVTALRQALQDLGLECPLYLTQNDGSLISGDQILEMPVHTFASGPTNSMRGAAYLSGVKEAIVVDIGGTTTDVGAISLGFPRQASTQVKVGGVRNNFCMPDVLSIGLGGGSLVVPDERRTTGVKVGPVSVGYRLESEGLVFGGKTRTASDIAVAGGLVKMGDHQDQAALLTKQLVSGALDEIHHMLEEAIDQVKLRADAVPVILVGGGSVLVDATRTLAGTAGIRKPPHFDVANAVGAALSQVCGIVDTVVSLTDVPREKALAEIKAKAVEMAVQAGAQPKDIEIVEVTEVPLAYLPGNATRILVKAVGTLQEEEEETSDESEAAAEEASESELYQRPNSASKIKPIDSGELVSQEVTSTGRHLLEDRGESYLRVEMKEPVINAAGEWLVSEWDLECIAIGAGILGCGGGGNPYIGKLRAQKVLAEGKIIRVISPERFYAEMDSDSLVTDAGGMGAPLIDTEKLVNDQCLTTFNCMRDLIARADFRETPTSLRGYDFYHYGAEIPIEEIPFPMGIPNGHWEWFYDHIRCSDVAGEGSVFLTMGMGAPLIVREKHRGRQTMTASRALDDLQLIGDYADGYLINMEGADIKEEDGVVHIEHYDPPGRADSGDEQLGERVVAVMAGEIGGMNSMEPLIVAAQVGLPAVDCDGMGRAFPELQMIVPYIYGCRPYPCALADDKGQRAVILKAPSPKHIEDHFRKVTVAMGCSAGLVMAPLTKEEVLTKTILYSTSRAWRLGKAVLKARREKSSPIQAVIDHENGKILMAGKVSDVYRTTTGGFNRGNLTVEGSGEFTNQTLLVDFQNENLVAKRVTPEGKSEMLACVPDLISVVDSETAEPVTTEEVRYGLRVVVVALACSPLLRSETALAVIGPQAFGYSEEEVVYRPFAEYHEHAPIPPR